VSGGVFGCQAIGCSARSSLHDRYAFCDVITTGRRLRIEAPWRRRGRREGQLIKVERRQFRGDQIGLAAHMTEAVSGGDGKLDRIIQARIDKRPLAVQLQIGHKGVPVNDRPPGAGPGMQVHARQPERGRNEGRCRLTVWAKSLAVQDQLAIEFARPPTGEDGVHGRLIRPPAAWRTRSGRGPGR
jgi:hypothetical protein